MGRLVKVKLNNNTHNGSMHTHRRSDYVLYTANIYLLVTNGNNGIAEEYITISGPPVGI